MSYTKEGRPARVEAYVPMVNDIIVSLGVDPEQCYNEEKGVWFLKKGSANVEVAMFSINYGETSEDYIEIASPIMKIPASNLEVFYKRLLELNDTNIGVKFSIKGDWIWLLAQRELRDLDRSELETMFHRIGNYADDMDDKLQAEFS